MCRAESAKFQLFLHNWLLQIRAGEVKGHAAQDLKCTSRLVCEATPHLKPHSRSSLALNAFLFQCEVLHKDLWVYFFQARPTKYPKPVPNQRKRRSREVKLSQAGEKTAVPESPSSDVRAKVQA